MNRVEDFRKLLFDVRLVPVHACLGRSGHGELEPIPGKRAVVDWNSGHVFSVVSESYQLVSNEEALEHAYLCCRTAFPEFEESEWKVGVAYAPATRGHCHIDLAHKSSELKFDSVKASECPEVYGPYIRVTNSYNCTRALRYDFGFMRKVCSNGLILDQSSVRFSLNHNTRNIRDRIEAELSTPRFQGLSAKFHELLKPLRECQIPRWHFLPITVAVLRIEEPKSAAGKRYQNWYRLRSDIESLGGKYVDELGQTAYALLNVITDIASKPREVGLERRDLHGLQRKAGTWLAGFSKECGSPDFDVADYVMELAGDGAAAPRPSPTQTVHGLARM